MKKVVSVVLAVIMAAALCVPVCAADFEAGGGSFRGGGAAYYPYDDEGNPSIPDTDEWLISPSSGIVVDPAKFQAGGGSFRGGGAGHLKPGQTPSPLPTADPSPTTTPDSGYEYPTYWEIPGDSIIRNPYYFDPTEPDSD